MVVGFTVGVLVPVDVGKVSGQRAKIGPKPHQVLTTESNVAAAILVLMMLTKRGGDAKSSQHEEMENAERPKHAYFQSRHLLTQAAPARSRSS